MDIYVARRALEARVKRILAKTGVTLKKTRSDSVWLDRQGDYYTLSSDFKVLNVHINLASFARDIGALGSHEIMKN